MTSLTSLGAPVTSATSSVVTPSWGRDAYRLGAIAALVGVAGTLADIALTVAPGWGPDSVPADPAGWCGQLTSTPWLALRNLDILNAVLAVVALPTYLAIVLVIVLAAGRSRLGLAVLGLLVTLVGATIFVAGNAALPMLELSAGCPAPGAVDLPDGMEGAMRALLARGAHGSYGALPGFLISEAGTAVLAMAMLGSRAFGRLTPWAGLVGVAGLTTYTLATTVTGEVTTLAATVAAPAGILMLVFSSRVAVTLFHLASRVDADPRETTP